MKKILLFIGLCFLMTGCSNTLKCVAGDDEHKTTYKIYYDNRGIEKINQVQVFNLVDTSLKDNYDMSIIFARGSIEQYDVIYDFEENDGSAKIDVDYNFDELDDEKINELFGTKDVHEFKKSLEQNGFKCK